VVEEVELIQDLVQEVRVVLAVVVEPHQELHLQVLETLHQYLHRKEIQVERD
jgi:hypothetical protein